MSASQAQQAAFETKMVDLSEQAQAAEAATERLTHELQAAEAKSNTHAARVDALEAQLRSETAAAEREVSSLESRLETSQAEAAETGQRLLSVEGAMRVAEAGRKVTADAAEALREEVRAAEDAGAALGRTAGLLLLAMQATQRRLAASEVRCVRLLVPVRGCAMIQCAGVCCVARKRSGRRVAPLEARKRTGTPGARCCVDLRCLQCLAACLGAVPSTRPSSCRLLFLVPVHGWFRGSASVTAAATGGCCAG